MNVKPTTIRATEYQNPSMAALSAAKRPRKLSPTMLKSPIKRPSKGNGNQTVKKRVGEEISPHISNSNCRLSFNSFSPTRYDDKTSSNGAQSSQKLIKTTTIEHSPQNAYSDSQPHHQQLCPDSQISKQISSDIKAIKIQKLIDFHREIE